MADIVTLAIDYGRYGYRRIHALLGNAGWQVRLSVVERLWRREGLKCRRGSRSDGGSGWATDRASACARSIVV